MKMKRDSLVLRLRGKTENSLYHIGSDHMAEKDEKTNVEDLLELEAQSLQSVVSAIVTGLNQSEFQACHIQVGDLAIDASKMGKNNIVMNLGTFRIELTDSETSIEEKMGHIVAILKTIKELGFRPDKMIAEATSPFPEEMYG